MQNSENHEINPNFAVICSFLENFGKFLGDQFKDLSIEGLKAFLESETVDEKSLYVKLHVILLRGVFGYCKSNEFEKGLIKFCKDFPDGDNKVISRLGYGKTPVRNKLRILKNLCEDQFEYNNRFNKQINEVLTEEGTLRHEPVGTDKLGRQYWYITDSNCGLRLFRGWYNELTSHETWNVVCSDIDGLKELIDVLERDESLPSNDAIIPPTQSKQSSKYTTKISPTELLAAASEDAANAMYFTSKKSTPLSSNTSKRQTKIDILKDERKHRLRNCSVKLSRLKKKELDYWKVNQSDQNKLFKKIDPKTLPSNVERKSTNLPNSKNKSEFPEKIAPQCKTSQHFVSSKANSKKGSNSKISSLTKPVSIGNVLHHVSGTDEKKSKNADKDCGKNVEIINVNTIISADTCETEKAAMGSQTGPVKTKVKPDNTGGRSRSTVKEKSDIVNTDVSVDTFSDGNKDRVNTNTLDLIGIKQKSDILGLNDKSNHSTDTSVDTVKCSTTNGDTRVIDETGDAPKAPVNIAKETKTDKTGCSEDYADKDQVDGINDVFNAAIQNLLILENHVLESSANKFNSGKTDSRLDPVSGVLSEVNQSDSKKSEKEKESTDEKSPSAEEQELDASENDKKVLDKALKDLIQLEMMTQGGNVDKSLNSATNKNGFHDKDSVVKTETESQYKPKIESLGKPKPDVDDDSKINVKLKVSETNGSNKCKQESLLADVKIKTESADNKNEVENKVKSKAVQIPKKSEPVEIKSKPALQGNTNINLNVNPVFIPIVNYAIPQVVAGTHVIIPSVNVLPNLLTNTTNVTPSVNISNANKNSDAPTKNENADVSSDDFINKVMGIIHGPGEEINEKKSVNNVSSDVKIETNTEKKKKIKPDINGTGETEMNMLVGDEMIKIEVNDSSSSDESDDETDDGSKKSKGLSTNTISSTATSGLNSEKATIKMENVESFMTRIEIPKTSNDKVPANSTKQKIKKTVTVASGKTVLSQAPQVVKIAVVSSSSTQQVYLPSKENSSLLQSIVTLGSVSSQSTPVCYSGNMQQVYLPSKGQNSVLKSVVTLSSATQSSTSVAPKVIVVSANNGTSVTPPLLNTFPPTIVIRPFSNVTSSSARSILSTTPTVVSSSSSSIIVPPSVKVINPASLSSHSQGSLNQQTLPIIYANNLAPVRNPPVMQNSVLLQQAMSIVQPSMSTNLNNSVRSLLIQPVQPLETSLSTVTVMPTFQPAVSTIKTVMSTAQSALSMSSILLQPVMSTVNSGMSTFIPMMSTVQPVNPQPNNSLLTLPTGHKFVYIPHNQLNLKSVVPTTALTSANSNTATKLALKSYLDAPPVSKVTVATDKEAKAYHKKMAVMIGKDGVHYNRATNEPVEYPDNMKYVIAGPNGKFYDKKTGYQMDVPEWNNLKHVPGKVYLAVDAKFADNINKPKSRETKEKTVKNPKKSKKKKFQGRDIDTSDEEFEKMLESSDSNAEKSDSVDEDDYDYEKISRRVRMAKQLQLPPRPTVYTSSIESDLEEDSDVETVPIILGRNAKRVGAAGKSDDDDADDIDIDDCQVCRSSDNPSTILLCDECDKGYHMACLLPPLSVVPLEDWYCPICKHNMLIEALKKKLELAKKARSKAKRQGRGISPTAFSITSENILETERRSCRNRKEVNYNDEKFDKMVVDAVKEINSTKKRRKSTSSSDGEETSGSKSRSEGTKSLRNKKPSKKLKSKEKKASATENIDLNKETKTRSTKTSSTKHKKSRLTGVDSVSDESGSEYIQSNHSSNSDNSDNENSEEGKESEEKKTYLTLSGRATKNVSYK
ncbi:PHD and RING finger domain-containing protein 1 [Mactra antiquata]